MLIFVSSATSVLSRRPIFKYTALDRSSCSDVARYIRPFTLLYAFRIIFPGVGPREKNAPASTTAA